jgi:molybdopterin synthase sulfur carrier subunit
MTIQLSIIGTLEYVINSNSLELENISDTNILKEYLKANYPKSEEIGYMILVNEQLVKENTPLSNGDKITLLSVVDGG